MAISGAGFDEIDKLKGEMLVLVRDMMRFCERFDVPEPGWLGDVTLTAQDFQGELDRRNIADLARLVEGNDTTRPIKPRRMRTAGAGKGRKKKG